MNASVRMSSSEDGFVRALEPSKRPNRLPITPIQVAIKDQLVVLSDLSLSWASSPLVLV